MGGGGLTAPPPPHPPPPQLFLPPFAPFARASLLRSEGLPRFLVISVLMPVTFNVLKFDNIEFLKISLEIRSC